MVSIANPSANPIDLPAEGTPAWLARLDEWSVRLGDRLNPILVKETRQALKSRQFLLTFSVVLCAALGWTVIGSLSMMPEIYTAPSAPRMLIGYYIVLAVPMMLVVPLAAYRSLEGEIDDGTFELLSITTLSPWQIVLGKMASAMLQMLLYFVALFPCVAYAYTLRGVDLPTTLSLLGALVLVGSFLTIVALFFAPLAQSRSGRIVTLLFTMVILLAAQFALGTTVINLIWSGNPMRVSDSFYVGLFLTSFIVAGGHLLLTATAAQLTPTSENRSTTIRISLVMFTAVMVGMSLVGWRLNFGDNVDSAVSWVVTVSAFLGALWLLAGSMMAAERDHLTPRIRRELPDSFLSRVMLTYLTPGPTTGLIFASVVGCILVGMFWYWVEMVARSPTTNGFLTPELIRLQRASLWIAMYAVGFLVAVRAIITVIRVKNQPRVEIGLAALVATAVLTSLVPYSIGLHLNDYRPFVYNSWQATNWVWTIGEVYNGQLDLSWQGTVSAVFVVASFLAVLLLNPKLVFPRRIATPRRVIEERRLEKAEKERAASS
jgi:ABC-type transport system involved in multi-copper enzyme maturation permease subunit